MRAPASLMGLFRGNGAAASPLGISVALFFSALFLSYGIVVPYFPVWLNARGLDPWQISTIVAAPLFIRLIVTPGVGLLADGVGSYRLVIVALAWCALGLTLSLTLASGYAAIMVLAVAFLLANGTMLPLIETIAVRGVRSEGLDYGRMRLWGSITFIVANFAGGIAIEALGGGLALWLIAVSTGLIIVAAHAMPAAPPQPRASGNGGGWRASSAARLLRSRLFILFLIAIGCTHGAHATFYTFGSLNWQAQGLPAAWVGALWAIGVLAEVALFAASAAVVRRFGPTTLILAGAAASVVRWSIMAFDPPLLVLVPLQTVHALTYGAAHLGAILFIARAVPHQGMGSAQAFYATVASGLALGIVGLISGALYGRIGGLVYLVPAAVALVGCVAAVLLKRVWDGRVLWEEEGGEASPTAPAAAR